MSSAEVWSGACLIWVRAPEASTLALPGQFVMVRCGEGAVLRRPFSIHRVDGPDLALLFAVVGRGTGWLSQRVKDDHLDLFGPLGTGFRVPSSPKNLLLVAGGIGIAPLVLLAEKALVCGHKVTLLLGGETGAKLYPGRLLPPGPRLVIATEDGSVGERGLATDLIPDLISWADEVFACGPVPMYRAMAAMSAGLPKLASAQVLLEQMMGCGLGACRGCSIPTGSGQRSVCRYGPVFELGDVLWERVEGPGIGRRAFCD
ncbi:dihydroorotate dehydrogenase electron transfer subunit [Chloroflexota bacterium]